VYISQEFKAYTPENHRVWKTLCQRRIPELRQTACKAFLDGMDVIGLSEDSIPDLAEINARLAPVTGWAAAAVPGYLPAKDFFYSLSLRKFPTTVTIRSEDQLDYLPEPDIFHDVFGHVPMHANVAFGDFLQYYGQVAYNTADEAKLLELARLFWFTVEFGLIREDGKVKLFGSGLMSSPGEGAHCLTDAVKKADFDLEKVIAQPFEIDHFQPILFVADSYEQLKVALNEWISRV
jgi:phenylalanine-4-hydroxylase